MDCRVWSQVLAFRGLYRFTVFSAHLWQKTPAVLKWSSNILTVTQINKLKHVYIYIYIHVFVSLIDGEYPRISVTSPSIDGKSIDWWFAAWFSCWNPSDQPKITKWTNDQTPWRQAECLGNFSATKSCWANEFTAGKNLFRWGNPKSGQVAPHFNVYHQKYACMHIYIYICTYAHACTHTHIYIYILTYV